MLENIKKSLLNILEGGGVIVNMFYSIPSGDVDSNVDDDVDDDVDEELQERLYDVRVEDGKIKKTLIKPEPEVDRNNLKDNSSLRKARLKSHTPQAKLKRNKSMMVRRKRVDKDM